MKTWKPTDTAATRWQDRDLELVLEPARIHGSVDEAVRLLRGARLTHEVPARWTRW